MKRWQRMVLVTGVAALGVVEVMWVRQHAAEGLHQAHAEIANTPGKVVAALPPARHFAREQVQSFLTAAKHAEAVRDPLGRCLAYPDPPQSHWSRDAVQAYCRYYNQPLLTFAQARALIEQGQAAVLDQRLADALQAQRSLAMARGRLDRIYFTAFEDGSFEVRPTLDAWKRQSPRSAFAWAASGAAYVAMAARARGTDYISNTSPNQLRAMDNLLDEAVADLHQAIALEPGLTPAHKALIRAMSMHGSAAEVDAAITQAIAAVPDDYSVQTEAMLARQPKWGGSLRAMDTLAGQAQAHVANNPMLRLLQVQRPYYQVRESSLQPKPELARYPQVLDRAASVPNLTWAGQLASRLRDQTAAAVWQSELLRFAPDQSEARVDRAYALMDYDELDWAISDLGRVLSRSPGNAFALEARAYAYDLNGQPEAAETDLLTLLARDPGNLRLRTKLGVLYMDSSQWGKSWALADAMIEDEPASPAGWLLRASIQQRQPRAGLPQTADQIEARFGHMPGITPLLLRMRADVALRKHTGIDGPAASKRGP